MEDKIKKILKEFRTVLKNTRHLHQFTQKQIAEKIGITFQSYAAYESGLAMPTLENFIKICLIFDIDANYLLAI